MSAVAVLYHLSLDWHRCVAIHRATTNANSWPSFSHVKKFRLISRLLWEKLYQTFRPSVLLLCIWKKTLSAINAEEFRTTLCNCDFGDMSFLATFTNFGSRYRPVGTTSNARKRRMRNYWRWWQWEKFGSLFGFKVVFLCHGGMDE